MVRSLQARLVLTFILFILFAMLSIGVLLLDGLERYFVAQELQGRLADASQLALGVEGLSPGGPGAEAGLADVRNNLIVPFATANQLLVLLLDPAGTILVASDPQREGQQFVAVPVIELIERREPASGIRPAAETGTLRAWAAQPVLVDGRPLGVLYVEGDLSRIFARLRDIRQILLRTGLIALGLTALVGALLARTVTRPIQVITAHAAAMAAGDFGRRIELRSHDEIGRLAEMFNYMAARLQQTLRQISDEKRTVEAILAHMADGVVAFDPAGRVVLANPAARRLLGLPEEAAMDAEPAGRPAADVWPDLPVAAALGRVLAGGAAGADGGWELLNVRRGPYALRSVLAPIRGTDGRANGAVWVLHDVSEIERLEQLRREFVANVSHELRTPLTTVKSYVETLQDGVDDPATRARFLQVIDHEVERMVRLVRDLLDLTQIEQGRVRWDKEYVRLGELAAQVVSRLRGQWEDKALQVQLERDPREPAVYVDPDRMQQVIVNLLANAIEFTPAGGRVTVRTRSAAGEVVLEVEDTGTGIPAEDLPRVFERFYRVDKARSRRLGGTGLGLSIVKEIVEAHGGRVGIDSRPGRGTRAWFAVPADPPGADGGGDGP